LQLRCLNFKIQVFYFDTISANNSSDFDDPKLVLDYNRFSNHRVTNKRLLFCTVYILETKFQLIYKGHLLNAEFQTSPTYFLFRNGISFIMRNYSKAPIDYIYMHVARPVKCININLTMRIWHETPKKLFLDDGLGPSFNKSLTVFQEFLAPTVSYNISAVIFSVYTINIWYNWCLINVSIRTWNIITIFPCIQRICSFLIYPSENVESYLLELT